MRIDGYRLSLANLRTPAICQKGARFSRVAPRLSLPVKQRIPTSSP